LTILGEGLVAAEGREWPHGAPGCRKQKCPLTNRPAPSAGCGYSGGRRGSDGVCAVTCSESAMGVPWADDKHTCVPNGLDGWVVASKEREKRGIPGSRPRYEARTYIHTYGTPAGMGAGCCRAIVHQYHLVQLEWHTCLHSTVACHIRHSMCRLHAPSAIYSRNRDDDVRHLGRPDATSSIP